MEVSLKICEGNYNTNNGGWLFPKLADMLTDIRLMKSFSEQNALFFCFDYY